MVSCSPEGPEVSLVAKVLNGEENYYTWYTPMRVALVSRGKLGYVTGERPEKVHLLNHRNGS